MPTIKIYSKEQVDALIASAGGLPDPTSASAGDVLTLDSNKDPAWAPVPEELPSTASASAGNVLALDSNKDPAWIAPSSGGDNWETLDLTNLPTDFADGDEIEVTFTVSLTVSSVSGSWTTNPTSASASITKNTNGNDKIRFTLIETSSIAQNTNLTIRYTIASNYIGVLCIDSINKASAWNTANMFTLWWFVFNGGGIKYPNTNTQISRSSIPNYIKAIKRKKATA